MKKLQNNFTTPEQSKRLLELGVPADSADCYYDGRKILRARGEAWMLESNFFNEYSYFTPCWSVGRLMEIFDKCKTCRTDYYRDWVEYTTWDDYVEFIIGVFNFWNSTLDFSKLEE